MYAFDDISHNAFPLGRVDMVPDFDNMIKGVKYMTTTPFDRFVLSTNLQRETSLNKWKKQTAGIISDKQKTKTSRRFHRACVVCPINDGAEEPRVLDLQSQKKIAAMFCVTRMGRESAGDGGHVGMEASKKPENGAVKAQKNAFERMMLGLRKRFSRRISPLA